MTFRLNIRSDRMTPQGRRRRTPSVTANPQVSPVTDNDKLLIALRGMTETRLHREVIQPRLRHMGADNVQYTHGQTEKGKDFVYTINDFYGDPQLQVCQVKNEPFSGRADHPS